MPLMERVREIGADEARLDEDSIRHARVALSREIARSERPAHARTGRRRMWTGIGIGGLVAGTAVTAIVVGSVVAPVNAPSASAAEVLNAAADATLSTEVLAPAPGQYIRISSTAQDRGEFVTRDGEQTGVSYSYRTKRVLYVPADRTADWIEDDSAPVEIFDVTDPQWTDRIAAEENSGGSGMPDVIAHPGGRIEGGDAWETHFYHLSGLTRLYDEMPREPQALAEWFEDYQPEPGYPKPELGEALDFNLAPAELRSAMFQAMALTPGGRVLFDDGHVVTIAIPDGGDSNRLDTVDVDKERGLIVGMGAVDSPAWSVRLEVSIVDSAPAGVHLQG